MGLAVCLAAGSQCEASHRNSRWWQGREGGGSEGGSMRCTASVRYLRAILALRHADAGRQQLSDAVIPAGAHTRRWWCWVSKPGISDALSVRADRTVTQRRMERLARAQWGRCRRRARAFASSSILGASISTALCTSQTRCSAAGTKPNSTVELLRALWGDSSTWSTVRHERDGYFIGLEPEETQQINAADCGYRERTPATVVENGSDDDDGMEPELFGEITPRGVEQLFGSFGPLPKDFVFFDLGSGVGKMATQVAIDYGARRSVGIELSKSRHLAGLSALAECSESGWLSPAVLARVQLHHGDLMQADLVEANVVVRLAYACG